jgi:hypothetical protein
MSVPVLTTLSCISVLTNSSGFKPAQLVIMHAITKMLIIFFILASLNAENSGGYLLKENSLYNESASLYYFFLRFGLTLKSAFLLNNYSKVLCPYYRIKGVLLGKPAKLIFVFL